MTNKLKLIHTNSEKLSEVALVAGQLIFTEDTAQMYWDVDDTTRKEIGKTYSVAADTLGLVKSGTDITVDASGNVSVVDDSHRHDTQYVAMADTSTSGYFDKTTTNPEATDVRLNWNGILYGTQIYGAYYNDYAEFRDSVEKYNAGQVVYTNKEEKMELSNKKFIPGARIITNTFGMAIGQEEGKLQVPVAVCGRVLAYIDQDINEDILQKAISSGENGVAHVMTPEEVKEHPDSIIGIISSIPKQQYFGTGKIKTKGKVWVEVR